MGKRPFEFSMGEQNNSDVPKTADETSNGKTEIPEIQESDLDISR